MNLYGRITAYCIENKKLTFLLVCAVILWGIISFIIMPKQYNPDIVAPAFQISVSFPGSTVDEVYQLVTKPLEDVLNEIPGVENIYSQSIQGGRSSVVAEFYVGQNLEKSMITLRQRIASRLNLAPLGASTPYISSIDPEDLPIKTIALYSSSLSPVELRRRAFYLKDGLKTIPGTAQISIFGGQQREFDIILDPQKMEETQSSLNEINQMLNNTSLLKELGLIKTADYYYHIELQEQALTAKDIGNIVIVSNIEEQLRIKDIATVVAGVREDDEYVTYRTKDVAMPHAVYLAVAKKKGTNIIAVSRRIDARLKALRARAPYLSGVTTTIVRDEGRVAREEITGLIINLMEAIGIVFIVLLGFLNHRAALIVASSIPITLVTTIAFGNLFGYTINRITLFALILSLGMLVDSATVVIENVVKNQARYPGKARTPLIADSVSEIGARLFLSTLTTVLAFIPMAFITGMMGPYIGPLPFFVSTALITSLVFAYTMNPWLASLFCKKAEMTTGLDRCNAFCQFARRAVGWYERLLRALLTRPALRRTFLLGAFLVLLAALSLLPFGCVRFRMLPKADREQMYVYVDLARGSSIERSYAASEAVTAALLKQDYVKSVQGFIGTPPVLDFNGLFRGIADRNATYQMTLKINLTRPGERPVTSEQLALRYRPVIYQALKAYPDASVMLVEDPPGPPVRSTYLLDVKCNDPAVLHAVTKDLEQKVRHIRGIDDLDTSILEPIDKYTLSVNTREAARSKISVGDVAEQLETVFSGKVIGVYHSDYNHEQEYIVLKFDRSLRDNIDDLAHITVSNALGNHIPLSQLVNVHTIPEENIVRNDNRERTAYVYGEMGKRSVTYAGIDTLRLLFHYSCPGLSLKRTSFSLLRATYLVNGKETLTIAMDGEWKLTVKVFRDLGTAMAVAVVLIYLVLVAQFNSFRMPVLIMGTIPLALVGVMPGFAFLFVLWRVYFSATSMIGVIALAGIVVNNAIILIEYIIQVIPDNTSLVDTLIDAGKTRMRPIMLTSVTTVLGSLVIAADPVWSGLSWSIAFGLSLSTVLALVVFPTLVYEYLGEKWFREVKENKK